MARHRSKSPNTHPKKPKRDYPSPRSEYVYNPVPVTVRHLVEKWEGVKGCSESNLTKKCNRERWADRREEYQARVMKETTRKLSEKDSDRRTEILEKASERHMNAGRKLQDTADDYRMAGRMKLFGKFKCPHCGEVVPVPKDDVKATDAFRASVSGTSKGVEIERKGLGIADRVEVEYRTTEIVREVIQVLEVIITDPDVMAEAVYRLQQIGKKDREELRRITAGGEVE